MYLLGSSILFLFPIIPSIPLSKPPQSFSQQCARLESEVLLERCGVGICDRDIVWLHRDEFLVSLEIR